MMKRKLQQMKTGQMFLTLPIQLMRIADWNKKDLIQISYKDGAIILRKSKD
jgi:hypothetical protein